jgi:hypothetical protein
MLYRLLADSILFIHFAWIVFMLWGFILTLRGFSHKEFFERWVFRALHFIGIAYVSTLAIMGRYCPLTIWENALRAKYDPALTYPGSFIIYYLERFVYPEVNPLIIVTPTALIALFTVAVFIIKPPGKIKRMFIK